MTARYDLDALRRDRGALVTALQTAGAVVTGSAVKCPFHEDGQASGSVHEGGGGWVYTCHACDWNGGKRSGDIIDVVRRARSLDFRGAVAVLGVAPDAGGNGAPRPANPAGGTQTRPETPEAAETRFPAERPEPAATRFDAETYAAECSARLMADPDALERLWNTRGVDRTTAERLGLGISADGRYWALPVAGACVKHHRISGGGGAKCYWLPKGANSRRLWPVALDAPGPVWLCPGELKAAAVIAVGRAVVGITGGETCDLPDELAGLLSARAVAVVGDDDPTGRAWVAKTLAALRAAGVDARAVDLGLSKADGLKDIGDFIQSRIEEGKGGEAIAAELDNAYELADPYRPFTLSGIWTARETWAPVYHVRTGLAALDGGLGGGLRAGAVSLFVGKSGKAKTQTVAQIALNAAKAGVPTCIVSLEMSRRDMAHLMAANLADVPRAALANGNIRDGVKDKLRGVLREYGKLPLTILDDAFWAGPLTRSKLAEIITDGCRRFGWRLVCLDYLGLLGNESSDNSDYAADLENSGALKRLANSRGIALVAVASLRKFGRRDEAPTHLDDIIGAGRIAYDSTSAFVVDCEQEPTPPAGRAVGTVRLRCLKSRYSALAAAGKPLEFRWWPSTGRVEDRDGQRDFDDQ
jgi:hypothetical protein